MPLPPGGGSKFRLAAETACHPVPEIRQRNRETQFDNFKIGKM
jgi:hypothetical protein